MARPKKSVFAQVRHPFKYVLTNGEGKQIEYSSMARVKPGKATYLIDVIKADALQCRLNSGVGSTSRCTVANAIYRQKKIFSHGVEGHVDWCPTRCYIVTKVNKFGLPSECVVYEHNNRELWRLNDTPGKLAKLIDKLEKADVPIVLKPYRQRSVRGRPGTAVGRKKTGARAAPPIRKGANRRYDIAQLGAHGA